MTEFKIKTSSKHFTTAMYFLIIFNLILSILALMKYLVSG